MTTAWIICRDNGEETLAQCHDRGDDLASSSHVRKVLDATFRGLAWQGRVGHWADKDLQLQIQLPEENRPSSISILIEAGDGVEPEVCLGGRFRTLARKRFWAVFDVKTERRVAFPPPRRRKYRKLPPEGLTAASSAEMPRSSDTRVVFYVEARRGEYFDDLLDLVVDAAEPFSGGRDFGVVETGAHIQLESGEQLYALGFKREYTFVETAVRSLPTTQQRVVATFEGGGLLVLRGSGEGVLTDFLGHTY